MWLQKPLPQGPGSRQGPPCVQCLLAAAGVRVVCLQLQTCVLFACSCSRGSDDERLHTVTICGRCSEERVVRVLFAWLLLLRGSSCRSRLLVACGFVCLTGSSNKLVARQKVVRHNAGADACCAWLCVFVLHAVCRAVAARCSAASQLSRL